MPDRTHEQVVCLLKDMSDPKPKVRKRIPPVSEARLSKKALREAVVAEVLTRPGPRCELAAVIPEVPCGSLTTPERPHELEVDEMRGGAYRVTEMYDPSRCHRTCHQHHDWKTANKREVLRRLGEER
jgi:hypothetical protein